MERQTDVMIVGIGNVGGWTLELLAREPTICKIVVADINETYGRQKLNTALSGAYQMGYYPQAEFIKMDLVDGVERNAEIIKKVNPRLIVNTTTMWSAWNPTGTLPRDTMKPINDAGALGPYLPFHLRLIYHLMSAVRASGLNPYTVNASFGDATGPCLKTQGLAFTVGMGNLDNMAIMVRMQVAEIERVKVRDVIVQMVSHHFNNVWFRDEAPGPRPPYFIKICVDGRDVTAKYDTYQMLKNAAAGRMRLSGNVADSQTGSAMSKNVLALLNDSRMLANAPSPGGLPGGYPVRIGAEGAKLALPEGITETEAIQINLEGQRRDGIKQIKEDGTVIYEDAVVDGWKKVMNFNCRSFNVKDVDKVAEEQMTKYKELIRKYGQI
jgi:hypothetical protein